MTAVCGANNSAIVKQAADFVSLNFFFFKRRISHFIRHDHYSWMVPIQIMPLFHLMSFFLKVKWHNCNNHSSIIMLLCNFWILFNRQLLFKDIQKYCIPRLNCRDKNLPHFKNWLFGHPGGEFMCTLTMPEVVFNKKYPINLLVTVCLHNILYSCCFFFFFDTIKLYFSSPTPKRNH